MNAFNDFTPCPFCTLPTGRIVEQNAHAVLILDGYPVSPGHSLVIPKRHIGSFFEVTEVERAALFALLDRVKNWLPSSTNPMATTSASTMVPLPARQCRTCTSISSRDMTATSRIRAAACAG